MSKKPILPVMLDLETLSLKSNAAVIDIAMRPACNGHEMFQLFVKPESYINAFEFDVNQETMAFHSNQNSGILYLAESAGVHWRAAAEEVHNYLRVLCANYEVHLWCKGKDADIPWLSNLLQCAGYKLPWAYKNAHCLRDLGMMYPEVKQMSWGNHTAAKDVEAQIMYLKDIASYSERAYNFIYGE